MGSMIFSFHCKKHGNQGLITYTVLVVGLLWRYREFLYMATFNTMGEKNQECVGSFLQ